MSIALFAHNRTRSWNPISVRSTLLLLLPHRFVELVYGWRQGGGLTMRRGLSYKGKNGPGLTNVRRVLTTRQRIQESEEPCKVTEPRQHLLRVVQKC